jgi:hypothetical protein
MSDPSRAQARRERRFAWAGTAFFAVAVSAGLARHEPWRDELQAWLVAERAGSWTELFANLRYEGHPVLWYALLHALAGWTRSPAAMQALHGLVACGFVFVFLRFAPFPIALRALFPLGYFAGFEFALVSRAYGLGVLLAFGACALLAPGSAGLPPRPYARVGVLLMLLAHTSSFGLLLAGGIGAALAVEVLGAWRRGAPRPGSRAALAAGAGLLALGVALSIAQIAPEPDNTFTPRRFFSFAWDAARFEAVARQLVGVFAPLPEAGQQFWETSWLESRLPDAAVAWVAAALLLVSALALADSPPALACHAAVAAGVLAASYYTVLFHFRYVGHVWIAWLVACWLAAAPLAGRPAPPGALARAARGLRGWLLALFLVAQAAGGVAADARDRVLPFSTSAQAARWIRERGLAELPIVGVPDYVASPLAAWLERDLYSVERGAWGSFVVWDSRRLAPIGWSQIAAALDRVLGESGGEALLVLDREPEGARSAGGAIALAPDVELLPLAAFPAGVVADERYFILLARRPRAAEPAPEALEEAPARGAERQRPSGSA